MDAIITGLWKKQMRIVLDIETNLAHDKIHLVVTKDIDTGEVRTWKHPNGLNDYLSKATVLIGHNIIGFDAPTLNRTWSTKIRLKNIFDTLIVSRLLDPSRENGHSLEAWGQTLGFHKIDYAAVWRWFGDTEHECDHCHGAGYFEEVDETDEDTYVYKCFKCEHCNGEGYVIKQGRREEYVGQCFDDPHIGLLEHYCIRDVEVTAKLYSRLNTDLVEKQFSQESVELEHKVAAIIEQQTRNGFKLDQPYTQVLLTDIKSKVAGIYEQMQQRWPPVTVERFSDKTGKRLKDSVVTFNPGSRQQIAQKLIELGWKPKKFTEKGQVMIDESILDEIIKECSK